MTKEYIFESFRALETIDEKIDYLIGLQSLNLPFDFNIEGLIRAWKEQQ